jgi:basic amino acid/polyamine antiporter, APA family
MEIGLMTDLTSIGTLFAFVLVAGGVLMLPKLTGETNSTGKFKLPYINGRFIIPILFLILVVAWNERIVTSLQNLHNLQEVLFLIFILVALMMTVLTALKQFSIIPVLGVLSCSYLLIEIPALSWLYFFGWMAFGLTIYFSYGYWKSRLASS